MLEPQPSLREAATRLSDQGWVAFPGLISNDELGAIREGVLTSVAHCGRRQVASGACAQPDGTAHHAVGQYPALDAFLERRWAHDHIDAYFGGAPYILHAFNPALVAPAGESYLHDIHRDVRTHAGDFRLLINMLVMVDPFTLENGATYVLPGSHRSDARPAAGDFYDRAERLTGPAGTIVLFDSNLWHAAGRNATTTPRCALTLSFSRAFVKQQMDYPRFLGEAYGERASSDLRQLLGYEAMTPTSYEEFYRPREKRLYKAHQG